jgi:hypothetical protein
VIKPMLQCDDVARLLSEQRDGVDISDRLIEVSAHLSYCAPCQAIEREYAEIGQVVQPLSEVALAGGQARVAIERRRTQNRRAPLSWMLRPAMATVPVAGILAAAVLSNRAAEQRVKPAPANAKAAEFASVKGFTPASSKSGNGSKPGSSATNRTNGKKSPTGRNARKKPHFEYTDIEKRVPIRKMDDIAYVTTGVEASMNRWAQLPADMAERIRRDVDGTIKTGDRFVNVPFPRVAGLSPAGLAAAKREYQREKEVIDPRLTRKLSLSAKGISFSDLCTQWTAQTGIEFSAGKTVADDKATIFCKDRPLRDIMRQITQVFGFLWRRSGEPGRYHYELYQDMRSQLLEEELRNKDRNEALVALDKEMQRYAKFAHLSPEQAREMEKTATGEDKALLKNLGGPGWAGVRLYDSLSPDQLAALRNGHEVQFSADAKPGQYTLPQEMGLGVLQSLRDSGVGLDATGKATVVYLRTPPGGSAPGVTLVKPADVPAARPLASLQMRFNELGQVEMFGQGGFMIQPGDNPEASFGGSLAESVAAGVSPSVRDPRNKEANARLASVPALLNVVTIEPKPSCTLPPPLYFSSSTPGPRATTADVWEAVHHATGIDIVADSFTKLYPPDKVTVNSLPLFDALNRLCDQMRVKWSRVEGWLQFRSTSFFNDRLKEVPHRLMQRWAESRKKNGRLTREDLLEIAQLTDPQLDARGTEEAARAVYGLVDWSLVLALNTRNTLRFLALLSPQQLNAVWSEQGVTFRQLPVSLQQKFVSLIFSSDRERGRASIDDIANASLRAEMLLEPETTPSNRVRRASLNFIYRYGGGAIRATRREIGTFSSSTGPDTERNSTK